MDRDGPDIHSEEHPEAEEMLADGTLGGYARLHNRPPAFEGPDGCPYTVSVEVEKTPNLRAPFSGFLVFPRWADSGLGVVGHVETPILLEGRTRSEVEESLGALTLVKVRSLLNEAVERRKSGEE
ncbi:hypothetical protein ACFL3S_01135 [Gemmatimonadota bacterium]